nr:MAG TPA: hypothetical protein [Caudoviricetes sp.]
MRKIRLDMMVSIPKIKAMSILSVVITPAFFSFCFAQFLD